MEENLDWSQLPRTQKYVHLVTVLEKIETNILYKGEVIEGNSELEEQRQKDLDYMNNLISDELTNDGITKMFVKSRMITPIKH